LGGNHADELTDVVVGPDGYIYIGGNPLSTDLPTTTNAFQRVNNGNRTGYVAKFSSDGTTLIYATYVGGSVYDTVTAIDVDAAGCAYITGVAESPDFPVTNGTIRTEHEGYTEAYIAKISPDGSKLEYSTFLGGAETEGAEDLIVDRETGECLVVGWTRSQNFPTTEGAYDRDPTGWDAFICGINRNGTALRFSSFLGGESQDRAQEVTLDNSGNIVVCGFTSSDQFPVTGTAYQRTRTGREDGFITVMDSRASRVIRSTYFGGSADDWCQGVVVTDNGDIAVAGQTEGHNLPVSSDAFDKTFAGGRYDLFISILNGNLDGLEFSSYLGGVDDEYFGDFAIDVVKRNETNRDGMFLFVMDRNGPTIPLSSLIWGYRAYGIAFNNNGSTIITGDVASFNIPVTDDAYQKKKYPSYHTDGIILILPDFLPPQADAGTDVVIDQHESVTFNGTGSIDNGRMTNWTWSLIDTDLTRVTMHGPTPSRYFDDAGRFEVTLNVTDAEGNWAHDRMNVTVRDTTPPVVVLPEKVTVGQNEMLVLNGSMSSDNVGIASWAWTVMDSDGPYQLPGEVVEYIYREVGVFNITLNVTDAAGNWAEATMGVIVKDTTPPSAMAGDDVEIDQWASVTFDGWASKDNVGIVNWSWSVPLDGPTVHVFLPTFEFTFKDAGEFIVDLLVTDAAGNVGGDSLTVRVRDTTDPVADAGQDMYAEQGLEVDLDGSGSTDNVDVVEWNWSFEDAGITKILSGSNPTYVFEDAGEYVVELTVTDAAGNFATDTLMVTIRDTTPPAADAGDNITVDQREEALFDGTASTDNVAVTNWTWRFTYGGTEHVLHGGSSSFIFEVVGIYDVTLEVRDEVGNNASDALSVTVADVTPPHAVAGSNRTVEIGEVVVFDGSASTDNVGVINWTWTFNVSDSERVSHEEIRYWKFHKEGEYQVHLTVRDGNGNEDSTQITVVVKGPPEHVNDLPIWFYALIIAVIAMVILLAVVGVIKVIKKRS
jgi:PKD repeat protein